MKELRMVVDACPECDSQNITTNPRTGETYCEDCGVVITDFVLDINYDKECQVNKDVHSGTGSYDETMQTYVGEEADIEDYNGRKLKDLNRSLRYDGVKRSRTDGVVKIEQVAGNLSLPDLVKNNSIILFKKLNEENFCLGKSSTEAVAGATVYWSCRQVRVPRRPEEITSFINTTEENILSLYRDICRKTETGHLPFTVEEYLQRFLDDMNINGGKRKEALSIADELKSKFNGKSPRSIVGGILRYVFEENGDDMDYSAVANKVGTSKVQLRKKCKWIRSHLNS